MKDIIVIGGGASGLIAAIYVAKQGKKVDFFIYLVIIKIC